MKLAGALTILGGIVAAAIFALLPTSTSEFGVSTSCGAPAWTVFRESTVEDQDDGYRSYNECLRQSRARVLLAGVLLAVTGIPGGLMVGFGWPREEDYYASAQNSEGASG